MTYATALASELAWYVDATLGLPALLQSQGGRFDVITSHLRRLTQAREQLYLTHGPTTLRRAAKDSRRADHELVALILTPATGGGQRANVDQVALETVVSAVLARIAGPPGDVGHGGRFWRVGPATTEPAGPLDTLRFGDAIGAAGAAHTMIVRYPVAEMV